MVTVVVGCCWASKTITPLLAMPSPTFRRGSLYTPALLLSTSLWVSEKTTLLGSSENRGNSAYPLTTLLFVAIVTVAAI
jgi:hypothetical protein